MLREIIVVAANYHSVKSAQKVVNNSNETNKNLLNEQL